MDFTLGLFLAVVATGLIWFIDRLFFRRHRAADVKVPLLVD